MFPNIDQLIPPHFDIGFRHYLTHKFPGLAVREKNERFLGKRREET